jgi:sugar phosphate permease
VPGLQAAVHLDKASVGLILGAGKLAYGVGQFVNGQMAERLPARRLLALGMPGSAALHVLFGFGAGFWSFLFVGPANGYFQSLGWPPCVRVLANWAPLARRVLEWIPEVSHNGDAHRGGV